MAASLTLICSLFFVMAMVAFMAVVVSQFRHLQPATYRLIVLSARTALFLPLCSFFIFIALIAPGSYVMMIFLVTIVEGYAFNSFFALSTENLGGPSATVQLMKSSDRPLLCTLCLPSDVVVFYRRTTWALFHVFVTRSVLGLLSAICFYANTDAGKSAYVFFNAISTVILFYGVVCLVNLYENVYEHCINLYGVLKLLLLKVTVGLIVLQGLIESILYSSGSVSYESDDNYSGEQKALRAYCGLVLMELALISVIYFYAYGDHKITPPSAPAAVRAFLSDRRSPYKVSVSGVRSVETLVYSFPLFLYDVLNVRDILAPGYFAVGDNDGDLSESLSTHEGYRGPDVESGEGKGSGGGSGGAGGVWGKGRNFPGGGPAYSPLTTHMDADYTAGSCNNDRNPASNIANPAKPLTLDKLAVGTNGSPVKNDFHSPFIDMEDVYGQNQGKSPLMQFSNPDHLRDSLPNTPVMDYTKIYGEFSDVCDQNDSIDL